MFCAIIGGATVFLKHGRGGLFSRLRIKRTKAEEQRQRTRLQNSRPSNEEAKAGKIDKLIGPKYAS